jgi:huntingtin
MESTEKIDLLFSRIRTSTPEAAKIYGSALCQIIQDLLPPNEILTKIIKELLMPNQLHQPVMARITYKVFRNAIDSSYLTLLQDWLICSLPNFLALPFPKANWCLLLIFMSASLNQHFIKLIPEWYACPPNLTAEQINYFILASKDFYSRLNELQKQRFKDVFVKTESKFYQNMLSCL